MFSESPDIAATAASSRGTLPQAPTHVSSLNIAVENLAVSDAASLLGQLLEAAEHTMDQNIQSVTEQYIPVADLSAHRLGLRGALVRRSSFPSPFKSTKLYHGFLTPISLSKGSPKPLRSVPEKLQKAFCWFSGWTCLSTLSTRSSFSSKGLGARSRSRWLN